MKFLPQYVEGHQLYPINIIYDDGSATGGDDILYIIYRDAIDDSKHVETIRKPQIEIWFVKEEFRNTSNGVDGSYLHDWIEKKYLESKIVRYKYRKSEAARVLNIPQDQVMSCPWVLGLDVDIRSFYMYNFILEYPYDGYKKLHLAFSDIESDVLAGPLKKGIDVEGNCPIILISYIDDTLRQVYLFALYNPKYGNIDYFVSHLDEFKQECYDEFTPDYGEFEYNVIVFDDEISLLQSYWNLVRTLEPDFMFFWNAPYDAQNLFARPIKLGYNPMSVICDPKFETRLLEFVEDLNPNLAKKKHKCVMTNTTMILCQMWLYAGIRSAGHKLPSTKLRVIGRKETGNTKIDLSEAGGVVQAPYEDFWLFAKYNIGDSLLQFAIEHKTKDSDDMYGRMYDNALLPNEVFTSTQMWAQYLRMQLQSKFDRVLCNNRNKIRDTDASFIDESLNFIYDSDEYDDFDSDEELEGIADTIEESQSVVDDKGKKKKFSGAIVQNPERMSSSGFKIYDMNSKYIHEDVIDEDITSEYPSAINITNLSNETFVGKIIMDDPYDVKLPMYDYTFANDEEAKLYKANPGALYLEGCAQGDIMIMANLYHNLPSIDELDDLIPEEFIMKG